MIGLDAITETLELVIYSGRIKGEQPVSALLTAPIEAGKTELVMRYSQNKGCVALTDATAYGIMRDYGKAIIKGEIRHIIIPDLIKPMSRGKDTVHTLVAFLNSLVEEGVYRVSTYAETIGAPTKGGELNKIVPVKCGLIATMAKGILKDGRHHWSRMGFMSRMLPISYDYSPGTQVKIHDSIAEREYIDNVPIELELPDEDVEVELGTEQARDLIVLTGILVAVFAKTNPEKIYGFRLQKQLQKLAMANAIKNRRGIVKPEDIEQVQSLSNRINLEYYTL